MLVSGCLLNRAYSRYHMLSSNQQYMVQRALWRKKKKFSQVPPLYCILRADFNSGLTSRLKTTDCKTDPILCLKVYNGALILNDSVSHSVCVCMFLPSSGSKWIQSLHFGSSWVPWTLGCFASWRGWTWNPLWKGCRVPQLKQPFRIKMKTFLSWNH